MISCTMLMTFITQGGEGRGRTNKKRKATKSNGRGLEEGASRALMRQGPHGVGELVIFLMMMTFITQGGEGRGNTNKKRKATKSKGSGLEEGATSSIGSLSTYYHHGHAFLGMQGPVWVLCPRSTKISPPVRRRLGGLGNLT